MFIVSITALLKKQYGNLLLVAGKRSHRKHPHKHPRSNLACASPFTPVDIHPPNPVIDPRTGRHIFERIDRELTTAVIPGTSPAPPLAAGGGGASSAQQVIATKTVSLLLSPHSSMRSSRTMQSTARGLKKARRTALLTLKIGEVRPFFFPTFSSTLQIDAAARLGRPSSRQGGMILIPPRVASGLFTSPPCCVAPFGRNWIVPNGDGRCLFILQYHSINRMCCLLVEVDVMV